MARWMPPYESGSYTPAAGARQADRFLAGLRRLHGGRRTLARLAALVALLAIVALLTASAARIFRPSARGRRDRPAVSTRPGSAARP